MPGPCSILNPTSVDFRRYNSMPDSAASPLSSPPASRPHSVTDHHHTQHHPHSVSSHPHPHPHPRSHPLDHAPRTGSPLARRIESPGNRVQFADDPERSRSPSIERVNHPGRINDMPTASLSAAIAARAGSPSLTSPPAQQQQQGLPPQRRLSSRRGSMAAVDPWGKHYNERNQPQSSTSRLTIVRVPNTSAVEEDPHGHSPSPGPYGGSRSFRERSHQRRSSWGANSGSDGEGDGRKRTRMSFAFSSFTPISPTPVSARQGPPQRTGSPGLGSGFAASFGPAQSRARTRSIGSNGGVDLSSHNPTQDRSGARQPQLSAQQLYELAMASRDPAAPRSTSVQGVSAAVEPAHFTALPEGEILPFLDRPGEVEALINTPGTQSHKLFALLSVLFPRPKEDEPTKTEVKEQVQDPEPTPKAQVSQLMWPPFPGEERGEKSTRVVQPSSPIAVPPSKAAPAQHPLGLPPQPTQWTYAQLLTHLTQTTREQLPDKEWVLFARACIRNRSEALWERVKGCLGVPNDIYEEDFEDDDEEESPIGPVGISDLANLSPVARFKALRDAESAAVGSDRALSDDEHEPEAWIEPVFPGGPGSTRGSVSNSPTHYFAGGVTGLGGGRGDSKSWAGSVSGRSDGGRMELIGEEEEEEEEEDDKDKNSTGIPTDKTPEPDSPVVGLRIMTAPMSPGFHRPDTSASGTGVGGAASSTPGTGDVTPSGGVPVPGTGSGAASPTPASPSPSIHQFLGPPMPKPRGGAWISPLSNTISTGGRGLSGMGGRGGAGWNSPTGGSGGGWNSPVSGGGAEGWNSPLSRGNRGSRGAWDPATERGPGNPIFPSSFARLSLGPTLIANNPNHRNPVPASAYPPFRYLRERYKWARPASENDFAITIASESSDAGGRY